MLFVIYCFVLTILVSLIPEGQGNCRNLKFTSLPKPGYRLENHTVRTIEVFDEDLCMAQCYLEPNCVSYNFHMIIQLSGTHNCDLNNATIEHAEDLGINENYIYRGAENACARNPCKNDATCQAGFTHRDYQCLCVLGYGFEGHDCDEDLDECTVGTHDCDKNAECNNTLGSYKCTCKDGFKGNGTNCTDLDECIGGTQDCDENAECYNTLGSYKCTCKDAFQGNGTNCTDIDECVTKKHHCGGNTTCNNTIGSYICRRNEGYRENEANFTDIDDSPKETNGSDVNADFNNTLGCYNCTCKDGFQRNENNCTGCSAPLGMESRHIKDSQITASSQWDRNHAAIQGRLNFKAGGGKTGGWSARSNNGNQWIQVALGSYTKLTSIATQGRNAHNQWVTAYKLQYSDDGMNFYYYKVPGHSSPKTFEGNKDRDSVVYHNLNPPIQARYIRLRPTAWYRHISLRMELYGCRGSQS